MDNVKVQSGNSNEDISKSSVKDNLSNLNTASKTAVQNITGNPNADTKQTVPLLDNTIANFANNNPFMTTPISKHGDPPPGEPGRAINVAAVEGTDAPREVKSNASLDTEERDAHRNLSEPRTRVTVAEAGDGFTKDGGGQLETMPIPPPTYTKQIDEINHKPVIDVDLNVSSPDSTTKKGLVIKGSSDVSQHRQENKESKSNFPSAKTSEPTKIADLSAVVTPLPIKTPGKGVDQGNNQPNSPSKKDSSPKLSGVQKNDDIITKPEEAKSTSYEPPSSPKGLGNKVSEGKEKNSNEPIKEMGENPLKTRPQTQEKESTLSAISKTKAEEDNDLYSFDGKEAVVEEVIMKKDVVKAGTDDRLIEEWRKSEEKTKERKKQDSKKDNLPSSLDDQILPKSSFGDQVLPGRQTISKESVVDNILDDIVTSFEDFAIGSDKSPKKNTQAKKDAKEIKKEVESAKNSKEIKREMKKEEITEKNQQQKKHAKEENINIQSKPYKQEPKQAKSCPKEMKPENEETKQIFESLKCESKEDEGNKELKKVPHPVKEGPKQTEMEPKETKQVSKSLNQAPQKVERTEKQTKQQAESPLNKIKQEYKETKSTSDSLKQESKQTKESPREKENLRQVSKSPIQQKKEIKETKQNEMQGIEASPIKTQSGRVKHKDSKDKRQESTSLTNLNKATTDEKKTNTSAKHASNPKETKSATARLKQEKELKEKHKEIVNAVKKLLPEEGHDSGVDESTQSKDGAVKEAPKDGRRSPQKRQPRSVDPSPMKRTPQTTASAERKLPMNKVEVGKSASPNIKNVRSKIGSLDNSTYKPGGGKVKIESKKLDFSKASSRIAAKNEKYSPGGGEKKIEVVKLKWNASSKVGSLDKKDHKPGGGDKKVESHKINFREKAESKVGSKDNIKHKAGGGDVEIPTERLEFKSKAASKVGSLDNVKHKAQGGDKKIFDDKDYLRQVQSSSSASPCKTPTSRNSSGRASGAISPATTGTISPGPQEE